MTFTESQQLLPQELPHTKWVTQFSIRWVMPPIKIRNAIIPVTQIGSSISMPIFIIGIALSFKPLVTAGILLFSAVVFFQLITLPVEFNASRRALNTLESKNILEGDELKGSAKVLRAAAMTYLAGLFSSLASLIRLIAISNRRD